jgi:probable rRNA maturation factor
VTRPIYRPPWRIDLDVRARVRSPVRGAVLARAVAAALEAAGAPAPASIGLILADDAELAELNATHMGKDGPTDVLSFPLDAVEAGTARHDSAPPVLLGDVVVCPAIAVAAAPDHGADADDELALLVVHGVLHVLGHDHAEPEETASMRERERALLSEFHWREQADP